MRNAKIIKDEPAWADNIRFMKCHICKKVLNRTERSFRPHMRMHIKNGEISSKKELEMRLELFRK